MPSTNMRALGRLAGGAPPPRRPRRRRLAVRHVQGARVVTPRPLLPRRVVVLVVVLSLAAAYLAVAALYAGGESPAGRTPAGEGRPVGAAGDVRRDPVPTGRSGRVASASGHFATVEGLTLRLPHEAPLAVAFHEATRPEALALSPIGRLERNDNPRKFTPVGDRRGPAYHVLAPLGRGRPPTSAADVVVPDGARVHAPVNGTVVEVREYILYGSVRDWRVVIEPDAHPDLHVVVIHLEAPTVAPGDRVVAGSSPLASARLLPFASEVDDVLGEHRPHVHIEVKPATPPRPLDPNEPAVSPEERLGR